MKNKVILISGVMGHIGFSLAIFLAKKKYKVIGIYNKSLDLNKKKELIKYKVKLIQNNQSSKKKLLNIIKKFSVTDCVYASAIAHDSIAKLRPQDTINVNSLYPSFYIDFQKNKNIDKFIYISTGSVFQNIKSNKVKISEETEPSPKSLYAISKRAAEIQLENNFINSQKKICILRISWIYGPPLLTNKIIPQRGPIPYILNEIIVKNKKKVFLPGNDFEASFTYIDDVSENVLKLIKKRAFTYPLYHLGTGKNNKIKELINYLNLKFKNISITTSKGFNPWSNDSIIRGPLINRRRIKTVSAKYTLRSGLNNFIKYIYNA